MSPSIWTRCARKFEPAPLELEPFRVVESQYAIATMPLVDSAEEQELLERLIDGVKPRAARGSAGLHFLLSTPFRHPPLPHGSRFGTRHEDGIWYGSLSLHTCFAEKAYYSFLFLEGTAAELAPLRNELTTFQAHVSTRNGADLTQPPFVDHVDALSSPEDYDASQQFGSDARAAGVHALLFRSARDPQHGRNLALLTPAFAAPSPFGEQAWHSLTDSSVFRVRESTLFAAPTAFSFEREVFLVRGRLPFAAT